MMKPFSASRYVYRSGRQARNPFALAYLFGVVCRAVIISKDVLRVPIPKIRGSYFHAGIGAQTRPGALTEQRRVRPSHSQVLLPVVVAITSCLTSAGPAAAQQTIVSLTAALSANPVLQGSSPAAIAVIGCVSACGTVTYTMDGTIFQQLPVNSDGTIASPPISSTLGLGSHTLQVSYAGNSQYAAVSTSVTFTVVSSAPTTLTLSLDVNPVPVNETPHMMDQVGCNSCGVLYYYLDGTLFQNSTISSTGAGGNLLAANIPLGWHILTASYGGNGSNPVASTSIVFHVITDTLPIPRLAAALSSSPVVAGTAPTVVTVVGCTLNCGSFSWYMDGQLFQTWQIAANGGPTSPPISSSLAVGSHTLMVKYSGDAQYAPATTSFNFTVVSATPTSLSLGVNVNPVPVDETPQMTSQVGCNACGLVYYYLDGALFQQANILSTGAAANILNSQLPLGWHVLTVTYPGNSSYSQSSITIPIQIVPDTLPAPSLTASLPTNPVILGTSPGVTTTIGCTYSCGYLSWFMDGQLFQNWQVASNGGPSSPPISSSLAQGPHTITIKYGGNAQYAPATASLSFMVTPSSHATVPAVTWAKPGAIAYGTTLSGGQLNASSSVPGTFTYSPASGTSPATGSDVLTVTFNPSDTTTYTQGVQSVVLTVNKANPVLTWASPSAVPFGTSLSATQLNATASVGGTFMYSPTLGAILPAGSNALTVTFTPTDTTDYAVTTQVVNLTVTKSAPVITWFQPNTINYGVALSSTQLNAAASVPGSFVYSPASGSQLNVGTQTLSVTFTPSDLADYNAVAASVPIFVATTMTLSSSPGASVFGGPVVLTATLPAGPSGAVTFFDAGALIGRGTIAGTSAVFTTSELNAGTHNITASWVGGGGYTSAVSNSINQVVSQATPSLTLTSSDVKTVVGATVTFTASISSGATGSILLYDSGTLIGSPSINDGTATLSTSTLAVGSHTLTGNWSGSTNYSSATSNSVSQTIQPVSTANIITTIAGTGVAGFVGDGSAATGAEVNYPEGVAVDGAGNIYIADTQNDRIRKINASTGVVSTIAGTGSLGDSGDGGQATSAKLFYPLSPVTDSLGNIYFIDSRNNVVRKISTSSGIISVVAGNGLLGYSGDGGQATSAELSDPYGLAVDASGNIFIADTFNSRVRKVTASTGIISTIAGNGTSGYFGDGGSASSAQLGLVVGVAVDSAGDVYIADYSNNCVREVTAATGNISTVAGNGNAGYSGDGGAATSASLIPSNIALDASGNLYVIDSTSFTVRKVLAADGIIETIAGNGVAGFTGDGGAASVAEINPGYLNGNTGLAIGPSGNLYIADTFNSRIRMVSGAASEKVTPTVNIACALNPMSYGGAGSACTTTVSGGATGTVALSYNGTAWTTLSLSAGSATASFSSTLGLGSYLITAIYNGDSSNNSSFGSTTVFVNKGSPVVTWPTPQNITFGTTLGSSSQLNASSNVAGSSFVYSPGAGTALSQGVHPISVMVTPSDTVHYNATTATVYIVVTPPGTKWDAGTVSLTAGGVVAATYSYGQGATPSSIAAGLANGVTGGSLVNVTSVDDALYVTAKQTGQATDYTYLLQTTSHDTVNFSQPSFFNPPLSGLLEGAANSNGTAQTVYSYTVPASGGYDTSGDLLSYTDSVMGQWSFTYDPLNRLAGASGNQPNNAYNNYCWGFDAFGNRTIQAASSAPFAVGTPSCTAATNASVNNTWTNYSTSNDNRIANSSQAVGGVTYDAGGNLVADGLNQYLYDGEGRICAVANSPISGGTTMTGYIYDAAGSRVSKGSITSWSCDPSANGYTAMYDYVIGSSGEQLTEMGMNNNTMVWQHTNVYAAGSLLATYDLDGLHFYVKDPLGSRRAQTDYAGVLEQTCYGLPFGDGLTCTNSSQYPTEHQFTGKERDTESGLDYFGARYYSSSMGRFSSPDPSGLTYANPYNPQSLNLYAYAYNNPLINIDPTGLECVWDNGSYDSNDDSSTGSGAVDGSGNHTGCSGQGGTWIDHSYFTSNNMADWSGQGNAGLADMITPSATVTFNYDASWAAAYLNNWAQGNLPTSIQYGQNDPATLAMVNRPLVQGQLAAYKAAGCPASSPAGQGSGDAYKETAGDVASGNPNYVQAEVGGYSGHFNTSGGVTTVTLSNVSGASSFFGYSAAAGAINTATGSHISRNGIDKTSGAMQNVTQTFTQTMPSPCGGG